MSKNYNNIFIASTIALLLVIGLAFQNCAAPLDPSLLADNNEELPSGSNTPQTVTFSSLASPMEVEEGEPVHIATRLIPENSNATIDLYKNGSKISSGQFYRDESVAIGDTFKVIVTNGSDVTERQIDLFIKTKNLMDDGNNGGNNNDGGNASGKVALRNISGTNSFTKYFIADKETKNFSVELDFNNTDSRYTAATISWEKRSLNNEQWVYHSSNRDITITGNPILAQQEYRAIAKHQGQVVGTSKVVTVITRSYTSSSVSCRAPYVMSGISSYTRVQGSRYCAKESSDGCDQYNYRYYNKPKTIYCNLPQSKSDKNNYFSSTTRIPTPQIGGSWKYCEDSIVRKSSLISALSTSLYSATLNLYCSNLVLGGNNVFETKTLETMSKGENVCPDYEYVVGLHRHRTLYRYGVIERLRCAEIAD